MRYAPLADTRLVVAGRVFRPYAASQSERAVPGCAAPSAARPGLDAGASGDYLASPSRTENRSGQRQVRGAAPEWRPPARLPGHGKPSTVFRSAAHSPASERPLGPPWGAATHEGRGGTLPPQDPLCHRQRLIQHARAPPVPRHVQGRRPRSASTAARLIRHPARAAARQRWPSCWCAPRGQALTQEPGGITFQMLARREERPQRTSGRSGPAAEPAGAYAIRRAPVRGMGVTGTSGTGRAQRRRISRCTDRPAGGCADKCTLSPPDT